MRGGIITEEDAALLRILAVKGREIVMVQMTGVSMTVTLGAGETWCAAATTASSSESIIIPKMTAVRDHHCQRSPPPPPAVPLGQQWW